MLVDLCNLVSIRYSLPVAAFDVRALRSGITVQFATGDERFTPLGESQVEHPEPGEVIFSDESKLVVARRWCWRQSEESAARPDTSEAIFTLEAQHAGGHRDVQAALGDMLSLLGEYAGGSFRSDILGPGAASRSAGEQVIINLTVPGIGSPGAYEFVQPGSLLIRSGIGLVLIYLMPYVRHDHLPIRRGRERMPDILWSKYLQDLSGRQFEPGKLFFFFPVDDLQK
jgi:hypothetical protein